MYLGGFVDGTLTARIGYYHQVNAWENSSEHLIVKMKKGSQFWIQSFLSCLKLSKLLVVTPHYSLMKYQGPVFQKMGRFNTHWLR